MLTFFGESMTSLNFRRPKRIGSTILIEHISLFFFGRAGRGFFVSNRISSPQFFSTSHDRFKRDRGNEGEIYEITNSLLRFVKLWGFWFVGEKFFFFFFKGFLFGRIQN